MSSFRIEFSMEEVMETFKDTVASKYNIGRNTKKGLEVKWTEDHGSLIIETSDDVAYTPTFSLEDN